MPRCPTLILLILMLLNVKASASTLLVDVGGSGEFTKIQDAINASEAGGEIIVLNGTYRENLMVDRSIILKGEGGPVVEGGSASAPIIMINASAVVLDGFVLSDSSAEEWDSGAVQVYSDGSKILNNTISGSSSHGISVLNSEDHLISGNHIHGNFKAGIHLAGANY